MPSATLPRPPAPASEEGVTKPLISKPLSQFTRLSPIVSLYTPPSITTSTSTSTSTTTSSSHDPTTILLCSWMNASPRHTAYYARSYTLLYPSARIILCTIDSRQFIFHSETRRRRDVGEAVSALRADDEAVRGRILVHAFSNGGAKRAFAVLGAYRAVAGSALPATALVLDCAPGIPRFRRDVYALAVPAARWPWYAWVPYMAATLVLSSVVFVVVNWLPKWVWYDLVWRPTLGVNDPRFVPLSCARGYIYTKEDLAMDWRDVESHAAVAEEKSYAVEKKLVEGAEHVRLFAGRGGEKDYWDFIRRVWDRGVGMRGRE